MKITVFTSNQPRHLHFIELLSNVSDEVYAIQECSTISPGSVSDFYKKSDTMQQYFTRVLDAERSVFGPPRLLKGNIHHLAVKIGDLNALSLDSLSTALQSDVYVVFGSSFIRGELCDFLVSHRAYNIHMGVSPYYRGHSTNFWALYDRNAHYVGATIHLLTKGLDSGPILFHALPKAEALDPFLLGMKAVKVAQQALVERLVKGDLAKMEGAVQDRTREVRYSRGSDFTDEIAAEYLSRLSSSEEILRQLKQSKPTDFVTPYYG